MSNANVPAGILDWDGEHGEFWVREQAAQDATLSPFVPAVLDAATVGPGDRVLDVGCGCGATTLAAAERGARVLGADVSHAMLARARERADAAGLGARCPGETDFIAADAQRHGFEPGSFDAVISRFGVMFFDDPAAAFRNLARALRPGGKLAFVCWQPARVNPHISLPMRAIVTAFPDALPKGAPQPPFSMAEPDAVQELLAASGFHGVEIAPLVQDLRVGDDAEQVLAHYLAQPMASRILAGRPAAEVSAVAERIRGQLAEHQRADGVYLGSAAWLVTAER